MTDKHYYLPFEKNGSFEYSEESIAFLSEYEKYQLSFHPERPKFLDFLPLFYNVSSCFDSDAYGANLIQTYRASLKLNNMDVPLMLIGQQSGPTSSYSNMVKIMSNSEEIIKWNNGMPTPEAYERAYRAVKTGNQEKRIIVLFVDTPGADPTEKSEERGIAWRIGNMIQALVESATPTISVILNRGCSGGAIAFTGCDVVLALENSSYLVISPEACSSILFHTRNRANEAAKISQITSKEGLANGIIDELIIERKGPAHRYPNESKKAVMNVIAKHIHKLQNLSEKSLYKLRENKWAEMGHWQKGSEEFILSVQQKKTKVPKPNSEGFIARHKGCFNLKGNRIFDPVHFGELVNNNFHCSTCGYRYA